VTDKRSALHVNRAASVLRFRFGPSGTCLEANFEPASIGVKCDSPLFDVAMAICGSSKPHADSIGPISAGRTWELQGIALEQPNDPLLVCRHMPVIQLYRQQIGKPRGLSYEGPNDGRSKGSMVHMALWGGGRTDSVLVV
jgi:hypothetical protein